MEPTLLVGDYVLVNKAIYGSSFLGIKIPGYREPARGDVVIFRAPNARRVIMVKRIVGLPGDTLEMRNRTLYVNGQSLEEPYTLYTSQEIAEGEVVFGWQRKHLTAETPIESYHPTRDTWGSVVVPPGQYFVLGDHRSDSFDSRHWGFVDRNLIQGCALLRYYSYDRSKDLKFSWIRTVRWDRIGTIVR